MKTIYTILLLLFLPVTALAQGEGNVWYFGNFGGMDFNGGPPVALSNGALNTSEGCASMSDNNGNLLFYTEGINVWNQNHTTMPNGTTLMGGQSTSQSAVIIKKPGSASIYYIFTIDETGGPDGMRYSEVDMTLQGGLGDVTANKNIPMISPVLEKVTAIKHANGTDFWVISHNYSTDAFYSFLVTAAGVNMVPVTTNIGLVINGTGYIGCMKGSHNGSKLAIANRYMDNVEIFDFDNSTGVLSNVITCNGFTSPGPYGVEFSPNDNLLYIGESSAGTSNVYQYNLLAGSPANIINSRITVGFHMGWGGSIQIGPDGKIYQARWFETSLGVINDPDVLGMGCNYVGNGFALSAGATSSAGLPQIFYNSVFVPAILSNNYCLGDSTLFSTNVTVYDSLEWDFGDTGSGAANFATGVSPSHVFTAPGNYTVTLNVYLSGLQPPITTNITIIDVPVVSLGSDTSFCPGDSIVLDISNLNSSYLWSNSATTGSISINQPGIYWAIAYNVCGGTTDTISITTTLPPVVNLGSDTTLCAGDTLILSSNSNATSYNWSTGGTGPTLAVTTAGSYWLLGSNQCGSDADTITVNYIVPPVTFIGNDTTICQGTSLALNAAYPNATYLWSTGATTSSIMIIQPGGIYSVQVNNLCGTDTDSIQVDFQGPPVIFIGYDSTLCAGTSITLDATTPNATYLWNNNSVNATISVSQPGTYWVTATGLCGTDVDSITINYTPIPAVVFGSDTTICNGTSFVLDATGTSVTYLWQDNSNSPTFTVSQAGIYWVNVQNNCGSASDTVNVTTLDAPTIYTGSDTTICSGEILVLVPTGTDISSYVWQDNSTNPTFNVTQQGTYTVTAINICGSATDSVDVIIEECNVAIEMPVVFSPNGDGLNDDYHPIVMEGILNARMIILSRWGQILFDSNNVEDGWDGSAEGTDCPSGTYFWIVDYNGRDNSAETLKGTLMLIR